MRHIYWVGIKESEIRSCKHLFEGSVTFIGSGKNGNISFSAERNIILNYNKDSKELDQFMQSTLRNIISKVPTALFFCYTPSYIYSFEDEIINAHIICANTRSTLQILRNKMDTRLWLNRFVPVLPTIILSGYDCNYKNLTEQISGSFEFIVQGCTGAGGNDTYIVTSDNSFSVQKHFLNNTLYLVSPFMREAYSVNVHVLFFKDSFIVLPGSVQMVERVENRMIYRGADFILYSTLSEEVRDKINSHAAIVAEKIKRMDYRGILGIDFLVVGNSVYFLEINPRFQSSTPLLNLALTERDMPTIQEIILNDYDGEVNINRSALSSFSVELSNYIIDYSNEHIDYQLYIHNAIHSDEFTEVLLDGYSPTMLCEEGASIFSVTSKMNLGSITSDDTLNIYDNIHPYLPITYNLSNIYDMLKLKIALMNQGIYLEEKILENDYEFQKGVYSSLDIYINENFIINCPIDAYFCSMSPFSVMVEDNTFVLKYASKRITNISIKKKASYCSQYTKNGISFKDISFLATDRLRIHHSPSCEFVKNMAGCRFCDVPGKAANFQMEDIKEAITWHISNSEFRHILIGGASGKRGAEYKNILEIVCYIRSLTNKPIYIMSLPPVSTDVLEQYYQAGVNEIAFNIEIFNRDIAKKIMPGKGSITLEAYKKCLLYAVKLWGNTGNVRSLLVYGLEPDKDFLEGVKWLASHGIQPIISPFRALKGTELEHTVPPKTEKLLYIYQRASEICSMYQLELGPECIYCQNNTISFSPQYYSDVHKEN